MTTLAVRCDIVVVWKQARPKSMWIPSFCMRRYVDCRYALLSSCLTEILYVCNHYLYILAALGKNFRNEIGLDGKVVLVVVLLLQYDLIFIYTYNTVYFFYTSTISIHCMVVVVALLFIAWEYNVYTMYMHSIQSFYAFDPKGSALFPHCSL